MNRVYRQDFLWNFLYVIAVVTEYASQRGLPQLVQLIYTESNFTFVLVPKTVATAQALELIGNQTTKCWSQGSGAYMTFQDPSDEQVNIIRVFVDCRQFINSG